MNGSSHWKIFLKIYVLLLQFKQMKNTQEDLRLIQKPVKYLRCNILLNHSMAKNSEKSYGLRLFSYSRRSLSYIFDKALSTWRIQSLVKFKVAGLQLNKNWTSSLVFFLDFDHAVTMMLNSYDFDFLMNLLVDLKYT